MPRLVITDGSNTTKSIEVENLASAVRFLSPRFQKEFPKKYVETVLNEWIRNGGSTNWVGEGNNRIYFRLEY